MVGPVLEKFSATDAVGLVYMIHAQLELVKDRFSKRIALWRVLDNPLVLFSQH